MSQDTTYIIPCGGSITIPANRPYEVIVSSEPEIAAPAAGGGPSPVPRPQWGVLFVHFVTPPLEMQAGENIAEAARAQLPDADVVQLPQGSTMVVTARLGEQDVVENVERLTEEVADSGLVVSNVVVHMLGPGE